MPPPFYPSKVPFALGYDCARVYSNHSEYQSGTTVLEYSWKGSARLLAGSDYNFITAGPVLLPLTASSRDQKPKEFKKL